MRGRRESSATRARGLRDRGVRDTVVEPVAARSVLGIAAGAPGEVVPIRPRTAVSDETGKG